MKKNKRLYIRVSENEKEELLQLAKGRSVSVTELLLAGARNIQLKDYTHEKQFLQHLMQLTKELHYLGNNINQATIAIHQINNGHKPLDNTIEQFNLLLDQYVKMRGCFKQSTKSDLFK